jgi:hypothetical protein
LSAATARFAVESFPTFCVVGKVSGQHLDATIRFEARIQRLVHLAHAAGPNELENLVGDKVDAGHERQGNSEFVPDRMVELPRME